MRAYLWIPLLILLSSCSIFDGNDSSIIKLNRTWEVSQYLDAEGDEISMNQNEPLTLRFSSEKKLGGQADCNTFGGNYRAKKNGDIVIKNLVTTEIACEEPTFGYDYLNSLSQVSEFEVDERKLILYYGEDGKMIFSERLD